MKHGLSVVINAQNAEADIKHAILSVRDIADEIVVIDQSSTDKTAEISRNLGANVYNHPSVEFVELARNFALSKAKNEWVLVLDPDEEISKELGLKISDLLKNDDINYYRLSRKNIIFGKWIENARWWPDYNVRLFRKGSVKWSSEIHSIPMTIGKGADIQATEKLAIIHNNYKTIDEYLDKAKRYTEEQSRSLISSGYKFEWKDLIGKPMSEFLGRYFSGEGYKDGIHGLALSLLQGFSEFLVYLRVWQSDEFSMQRVSLKESVSEMQKAEKELRYWQNDKLFKEFGNLKYRIKKTLRI